MITLREKVTHKKFLFTYNLLDGQSTYYESDDSSRSEQSLTRRNGGVRREIRTFTNVLSRIMNILDVRQSNINEVIHFSCSSAIVKSEASCHFHGFRVLSHIKTVISTNPGCLTVAVKNAMIVGVVLLRFLGDIIVGFVVRFSVADVVTKKFLVVSLDLRVSKIT